MSWLTLLFDPRGRIDRRAWWTGTLLAIAAALLGSVVLDPGIWQANPPRAPAPVLALWNGLWVGPLAMLAAKRFRDRGRSGWLGGALGVLGLVLIAAEQRGFLVDPTQASTGDWALLGASILIFLLALVDLGAGPSRAERRSEAWRRR